MLFSWCLCPVVYGSSQLSLSSYHYHEYDGILTVFHGVWITLYHTVNSGARAPSGHKHHMHFFLDNQHSYVGDRCLFLIYLLFSFISTPPPRYKATQESSCSRQELSGDTHYAVVHQKKWFVLRQAIKHRHNHGRRRRKCPRNDPHQALRLIPTCQIDGRQPPEQADIMLGVLRGCTPPQPLKNCIRLLGGSSPIAHQAKTIVRGAMPRVGR